MIEYEYPARPELPDIHPSIVHRYIRENLGINPLGVTMGSDKTVVIFETALTPAEKATLDTLMTGTITWTEEERYFSLERFGNVVYGSLVSVDVSAKKGRVERIFDGKTFTRDCHVTQSVADLWVAGKLVVGDTVIVVFVDNDMGKPLIIDKVVF